MNLLNSTALRICMVVGMFLGVFLFPVHAQESSPVAGVDGLMVFPAKMDRQIPPGGTYRQELRITNNSDKTQSLVITTEDFIASQDPRAPVQLLGETSDVTTSLKEYLFLDKQSLELGPGESDVLLVTVRLPDIIQPGGYYASVLVSTQPEKTLSGTGALTVSRVASLFFVSVPGEVNRSTNLNVFEVVGGNMLIGQQPTFQYVVENRGDIHVIPYGGVTLTKGSGKIVGSMAIEPFFVLPQSERAFSFGWAERLGFGRYTATLELNKGYADEITSLSYTFWLIPWTIIVAGMLLILIFGFLFHKKLRS